MKNKRRRNRFPLGREQRTKGAMGAGLQVTWVQGLCAGGIALLAAAHLASIVVEF